LPPVDARGCDGVDGLPAAGEACRPLPVDGCSEGPFEADAWPVGTVFVRAGAADGNGSAERPFGTLEAALAVVGRGGTVGLGPGRYAAPTLNDAVTLQGRCARDVVLEGALTAALASEVTLIDLGVEGTIDVEADALAMLERVQLTNVTDRPALRVGGVARATALRVLGPGEGVRVVPGGRLDCAGCVVHGTAETGIQIDPGAEATLEDAVVLLVAPGERPFRGFVHVAGSLHARGLTVLGSLGQHFGRDVVAVKSVGGEATLDHVRVASIRTGLLAEEGGDIIATDLVASRMSTSGVQAQSGGTVRGARWRIDGSGDSGSGGITTFRGGRVVAEQVDIRFERQPLFLAGPASSTSLRDTRLDSSRHADFVVDGADLVLQRARIIEVSPVVLGRDPTETSIRFEDVELLGAGLSLWRAEARITRVSIDHPFEDGIGLIAGDSVLRLRDVFVRSSGVTVRASGGSIDADGVTVVASPVAAPQTPPYGAGVEVIDADGEVAHVATTGTWHYGVAVARWEAEAAPQVRLSDIRVQGVRPDPYGFFVNDPKPAGVRVLDASVSVDRLSVTDVPGPGLLVSRGGSLTARRVALHDTGTEQDDDFGRGGLVVTEAGRASIEDLDVRRALGFGVTVDGSDLTLARAHVSDVLPRADGPPPTAVLSLGGQLDLAGLALATDGGAALVAQGGTLTLADGALRGGGIATVGEASVDVERVAVRGGESPSLLAADGSQVSVRNLLLADAAGGIAAASAAEVTLEDAVIDHPAGPGLTAHAANVTARNVAVTAPAEDAACAWATDRAGVTLEGARLGQCGAAGVATLNSTLVATDVLIEAGAGHGAACDGGELSLTTFRVERNAGAGVVARDCEATLTDGWLVANGAAWTTHPGGAARADDVARRGNEVDTAECLEACDPLPSPPAAPTPPLVEPLERWPPPPWFGVPDEDEK
ncbi:MAG: hypothetical protein KC583_23570, partial [Myxococcales bacterium]|nr:hypothetical protein [Myxococcales bacterium]